MLFDEKNKIYQDDKLRLSVSSWTNSQYISSEDSLYFDEDENLNNSLVWNMLENEEFQDFSDLPSSENSEKKFNEIRLLENIHRVNCAEKKDEVLDEDLTEITLPSNFKQISILNNIFPKLVHNEKEFYTKSSIWLDPDNIDREYSEYYLGESSILTCKSLSKIKLHENHDSTLSDITEISDLNLSRSSSSNIERESDLNEKKPKETLIQTFQKMIGKNFRKKKLNFSKGSENSVSSSSSQSKLFENLTINLNKRTPNFSSSQKLASKMSSNECSFSSLNEKLEKSNINNINKLKNPLKFLKSNAKQLFSFKKKLIPQTAAKAHSNNFFNQTSLKIFKVSQIFHDEEQVNIKINVVTKLPLENDLDKNKSDSTDAKKFEINISIIS